MLYYVFWIYFTFIFLFIWRRAGKHLMITLCNVFKSYTFYLNKIFRSYTSEYIISCLCEIRIFSTPKRSDVNIYKMMLQGFRVDKLAVIIVLHGHDFHVPGSHPSNIYLACRPFGLCCMPIWYFMASYLWQNQYMSIIAYGYKHKFILC